jgi:hypothetical protein
MFIKYTILNPILQDLPFGCPGIFLRIMGASSTASLFFAFILRFLFSLPVPNHPTADTGFYF